MSIADLQAFSGPLCHDSHSYHVFFPFILSLSLIIGVKTGVGGGGFQSTPLYMSGPALPALPDLQSLLVSVSSHVPPSNFISVCNKSGYLHLSPVFAVYLRLRRWTWNLETCHSVCLMPIPCCSYALPLNLT